MAWRVGMKAICVDPGYWEQNPLVKGAVYTVLEIDGPYLGVDAYVTNGGNKWRARRFRPVVDRKTDISIFEEIRDGKRRVADEPIDPAFETAWAEADPSLVQGYVRSRT